MTRPFDDDMAGGRAAAEADTTEEAIYDAAHEMLWDIEALTSCCGASMLGDTDFCAFCRDHAVLEVECPGCGKPVANEEEGYDTHARSCGALRARVIEDWQAEDDYREARR